MKMGFEQGALSIPTPEEEQRKELMKLREELKLDRERLVFALAELEDMAGKLGIDLANDYDPRLKTASYFDLHDRLMRTRMEIADELEESELVMDEVLAELGESRTHDA